MKILSIAEFDPAGVLSGHKRVLQQRGVDYRLAVHGLYAAHVSSICADWILLNPACDFGSLAEFAAEADILQFHPVIGQPWSYASRDIQWRGDADELPFGRIDWRTFDRPSQRRIAYFHGSRNAALNVTAYASLYRGKGMTLWTSTLDYATWLPATFAPPIVALAAELPAVPLRGDGEPLIVAHTPTDPENCHTALFLAEARRAGVVVRYATRVLHREVIALKRTSHAGFDHMRGAFSVNSLENAALGLVPIGGFDAMLFAHPDFAQFCPHPFVEARDAHDLCRLLRRLDEDPAATRERQLRARAWMAETFSPARIGAYLVQQYRRLT